MEQATTSQHATQRGLRAGLVLLTRMVQVAAVVLAVNFIWALWSFQRADEVASPAEVEAAAGASECVAQKIKGLLQGGVGPLTKRVLDVLPEVCVRSQQTEQQLNAIVGKSVK